MYAAGLLPASFLAVCNDGYGRACRRNDGGPSHSKSEHHSRHRGAQLRGNPGACARLDCFTSLPGMKGWNTVAGKRTGGVGCGEPSRLISSRRNGIISRFDLSHHRTCRPAYGGSLINP
ncbi:MAG: hypothetical protein LBF05_02185 [Tannerella sp.]|nr:hypothetical protein [Tannerella sp.]